MVLILRLISTWFHKTHAHSGGRRADRREEGGGARYHSRKVHQGVMPPGMPVQIAVLFGDGRACGAREEPLLKAQTRYEFELPGFGTFSFHLGCFGLYIASSTGE